jgi:hypothetical protein
MCHAEVSRCLSSYRFAAIMQRKPFPIDFRGFDDDGGG